MIKRIVRRVWSWPRSALRWVRSLSPKAITVIGLLGLAAYVFVAGQVSAAHDRQQAVSDRRQDQRQEQIITDQAHILECVTNGLGTLADTLKQQQELADPTGKAVREEFSNLTEIAKGVLAPTGAITPEEARMLFEALRDSGLAYSDLSLQQSEIRDEHPLPTKEEVLAQC